MILVLSVAGFVLLIAIIWCIRTMKRGFTPLSKNQELWRAKFKAEELKLAKEQEEITESEQLHFLEAAIKDLLNLDNLMDFSCTRKLNTIKVQSPSEEWTLSYHAIEQKLNKLNKVVHGKAHWVLVAQDKSYDFETIDKLMQTFRQLIHGEKLEEEPNLPFLQHRKKKTL